MEDQLACDHHLEDRDQRTLDPSEPSAFSEIDARVMPQASSAAAARSGSCPVIQPPRQPATTRELVSRACRLARRKQTLPGARSAVDSQPSTRPRRTRSSQAPDTSGRGRCLSARSSVATAGGVAAPLQMEQSVDVGGALLQLVHSAHVWLCSRGGCFPRKAPLAWRLCAVGCAAAGSEPMPSGGLRHRRRLALARLAWPWDRRTDSSASTSS